MGCWKWTYWWRIQWKWVRKLCQVWVSSILLTKNTILYVIALPVSKEICIFVGQNCCFSGFLLSSFQHCWKTTNHTEFAVRRKQLIYSSFIAISWHPNPIKNTQVQYLLWFLMCCPGFPLFLLGVENPDENKLFSFLLVHVITADLCPLHGFWL